MISGWILQWNLQTKAILKLYEEFADGSRRQYPKEWENRYTNGHYKRGVE